MKPTITWKQFVNFLLKHEPLVNHDSVLLDLITPDEDSDCVEFIKDIDGEDCNICISEKNNKTLNFFSNSITVIDDDGDKLEFEFFETVRLIIGLNT